MVGEPTSTIAYSGTAVDPSAHVFAQIVDRERNIVLGNQATPIPLTLDGKPHTVTRALEGVAASVGPDSDYALQLTGGTLLYGPTRNAGTIDVAQRADRVADRRPGRGERPGRGRRKPACRSTRRFRIKLSRSFKRAKVWVAWQAGEGDAAAGAADRARGSARAGRRGRPRAGRGEDEGGEDAQARPSLPRLLRLRSAQAHSRHSPALERRIEGERELPRRSRRRRGVERLVGHRRLGRSHRAHIAVNCPASLARSTWRRLEVA